MNNKKSPKPTPPKISAQAERQAKYEKQKAKICKASKKACAILRKEVRRGKNDRVAVREEGIKTDWNSSLEDITASRLLNQYNLDTGVEVVLIEKINDLEKTMQSAGWNLKDAPVVLAEMLSLAPQKVKKMIVAATDSLPSIGMSQASAESDDEAQK